MSSAQAPSSPAEQALLDAFGEDLWLKRCQKLDEVIDKLESLLRKPADARAPAKGVIAGEVSTDSVQSLKAFVEFLRSECSGESFSDERQWSQLMNSMRISRKLNHRSVKFKDVLKNRPQIEANGAQIKLLNEQARLGRSLVRLIEAFETNLAKAQLVLLAESKQSSQLAEISGCQRNLDSALKPIVNNLHSYLQNKLISTAFSTQVESWSKKADLFTRATRLLCGFIKNYLALKEELAHLRPLVGSLSDAPPKNGSSLEGRDFIESSLASCKLNFGRVVDFERALEQQLRSISSSARQVDTTRKTNDRKQNGARRSSSVASQEVQLKLVKLLKPNKLDELASDLYGIKLEESLVQVQECRATLKQLMSSLRFEFGRFYFVNDSELLRIISLDSRLAQNSADPENQRMIRKLFNGSIERFLLDSDETTKDDSSGVAVRRRASTKEAHIVAVQNPVGERIWLSADQEPVPLRKRLNIYSLEIVRILNELIRKLQRSLSSSLAKSLCDTRLSSSIDWSLPVQLLELAERIKFTRQVEFALADGGTGGSLRELLAHYENRLENLSTRHGEAEQTTGQSKPICELKRSAAVSLTIHIVSSLLALIKTNTRSTNDWNWQKLARFYYQPAELLNSSGKAGSARVRVCLANSEFDYKFDLLPIELAQTEPPSVKRLVYTETSERCFLVASQAIGRLKLGACPLGPAGSGKTETVKALGQLLGCQVIVHNCDETNDSQALERLVWGLAHTGLWGCFDEFNRLSPGTLSSVSSQLELVQSSLRANRTTLELNDGQMKSIDRDSAFFVTLNPGDGLKYRGRRRLPANLRSLFLSVAMVRVQMDAIVREMLLVFAATANSANRKLCISAQLAEEIGSRIARWIEWERSNMAIERCEWDLRLVMTILRRFKAATLNMALDGRGSPELVNNSKLVRQLVEEIVREVAPRLREDEHQLFGKGLELAFDGGAVESGRALLKQLGAASSAQLEEQLENRPGVILLGPSQCGKSSLWRSLANEKNQANPAGHVIGWHHLNPRSCSTGQLFGHFGSPSELSRHPIGNNIDNTWSDGLLTRLVRRSLNELNNSNSLSQIWLVLDGPLDPDWIESLNSVLDDNQMLTLSSGERLNFVTIQEGVRKCIKLIFETDDISDASPATISRLGLIDLTSQRRDARQATTRRRDSSADAHNVELIIYRVAGAGNTSATRTSRIMSDLKERLDLNESTWRTFELACFEGATSRDLLEVLQLTRTGSEQQALLLIHDVHLIQSEDRWQTRTFIELLRFVVTSGTYHDKDFDLTTISSKLKIVLVSGEDLSSWRHFERLAALARYDKTLEISEELEPTSSLVSIEHLADWCCSLDNDKVFQDNSMALLVECDLHCMGDLLGGLVERLGSINGPEVCEFNNSSNVLKSIDYLLKISSERSLEINANEKRPVVILNSLQMSLMGPRMRAHLCRALNLIRLRHRLHLDSNNLRCLYLFDRNSSSGNADHAFWSQLATSGSQNPPKRCRLEHPTGAFLGTQRDEISVWLTERLAECKPTRSSLEWLTKSIEALFGENHENQWTRSLFLKMFVKMTLTMKRHTESQRALLVSGLRRLTEFGTEVERMRKASQAQEASLAERQQQIETLLEKIARVIENGHGRKLQLEELRVRQDDKSRELAESRKRIEKELATVLPLIESSKQEINQCLKVEALNEIKSLRAPPKTIKDILDVLFVLLLDQKNEAASPPSWSEIKSYLTRYSLREELTTKFNFQKRLTDELLIARLEKEISAKRDSFRLEQAERASAAIVPVVRWIEAAREYGRVLTRVKPLRASITELEREHDQLDSAMDELRVEQEKLDEKIRHDRLELAELESSHATAKKQLDQAKLDVDRAQNIKANLGEPLARWQAKLMFCDRIMKEEHSELLRTCLICASVALRAQDTSSLEAELRKWCNIFDKFGPKGTKNTNLAKAKPIAPSSVGPFITERISPLIESATGEVCNLNTGTTGNREQLDQLVKLLVCKLNLCFNSQQLLFLWADQAQSISSGLVQYLQHAQVLTSHPDHLVLLKPSLSGDWQQGAREELDLSRRKILLMEMSVDTDQAAQDDSLTFLDILDCFLYNATPSLGVTPERRVILVSRKPSSGLLDGLPRNIAVAHQLMRVLEVGALRETYQDPHALNQLATSMTDALVEHFEPEMGADMTELQAQLRERQAEVRQLEANLMSSLQTSNHIATSQTGISQTSEALSSSNELVRLLIELNQSSETLSKSIEQISEKLRNLQMKRDKFQSVASRAAIFYANHLACLKDIDSFYHLSPRCFVRSFARMTGRAALEEFALPSIELVMCSMRPVHRQTFEQSFALESRQSESGKVGAPLIVDELTLREASQKAVNLKQNLVKMVANLRNKTNQSSSSRPAKTDSSANGAQTGDYYSSSFGLAIILHDSRKSSPQMEVDGLFGCSRQQDSIRGMPVESCQYHKLYATSSESSSNQLETQIKRILSSDLVASPSVKLSSSSVRTEPITTDTTTMTAQTSADSIGEVGTSLTEEQRAGVTVEGKQSTMKCICIANAHLAARWINTRLLELVGAEPCQRKWRQAPRQVLLVIIVAECDEEPKTPCQKSAPQRDLITQTTTQIGSLFNPNLLEEASLRFWYDELSLELPGRFKLYKDMVASEGASPAGPLVDQLILFHVVCQELIRNEQRPQAVVVPMARCWLRAHNYSFDSGLLSLALKVLRQIDAASTSSIELASDAKRSSLCDQLESIVYGARMETEQDEQQLHRLMDGFLRSADSARRKMAQFEMLARQAASQDGDMERKLRQNLALLLADAE